MRSTKRYISNRAGKEKQVVPRRCRQTILDADTGSKNGMIFQLIVGLLFLANRAQSFSFCFAIRGDKRRHVLNPLFALDGYRYAGVSEHKQNFNSLERAGGIMYRTSVFSREEIATISKEVALLSKNLREESTLSVAANRLGAEIPAESRIHEIFATGSLHRLVEKTMGGRYELSNDLPLEIRSYEKKGASMAWHVDDVLYDPPQIEFVWTLENCSDCATMWKQQNNQVQSVETEGNSVILLQAGGPSHCVTSLKRGKRVILKSAFVEKGAVYAEGQHTNQFQKASLQQHKKRRNSKKKKR